MNPHVRRLFVFICMILTCQTAYISEYERWRPILDIADNKIVNARFHRAKAFTNHVKQHILGASEEIRKVVRETLLQDGELSYEERLTEDEVDSSPFVSDLEPTDYCSDDLEDVDKALNFMNDIYNRLISTNKTCPLCQDLFSLLQRLACSLNPHMWARLLIKVCEIILEKSADSNPAMCEGTILLQGPFMYTVLLESSPYDYCDTLNMCPPAPEPTDLSVREKQERMLGHKKQQFSDRKQSSNKSNNQIKILHLADIHISTVYAVGSATDCDMYVCCRHDFPGNGSARVYGEYTCNIPERTMHYILNSAMELKPDFVIYTGDSSPHTFWEESLQSQLNCSSIVVRALRQHFTDLRIYPSIGNHEMFPTNIYTLDERYNHTAMMNDILTEFWRHLAGFEEEQQQTMRQMSYYSMLIPGYNNKIRILSLNTNHYCRYSLNFMAPLNRNTSEEKQYRSFIVDTLNTARQNHEKVIIIGHHPVSSLDSTIRATRWWEDVVIQFSDVIIMILSGHTHNDEYHLFTDWKTGVAKVVNYVAPSVSSKTFINPSMRMFYLDDVTLEVSDYENYYVDMETQDGATPPSVKLNYKAKELYGLQDLSAESWKELSMRFIDDTELFQLWCENRHAKGPVEKCDEECHKFHICSMWFPNYDEVESCVLEWDDDVNSGCTFYHGITGNMFLLLIVLLALRLC